MEYTQDELKELIKSIAPEVIKQEQVYAGFRVLQQRYLLPTGDAVVASTSYLHSADSESWAAVASYNLTHTHNV